MDELSLLDLSPLEPFHDYFEFSDNTECSSPTFPRKRPLEFTLEETDLLPGTAEYKKARKRRQNRESAARSRARKRMENDHLETTIEEMTELNSKLIIENEALKSENEMLKKELEFYKGIIKGGKAKISGNKASSKWLLATIVLSLLSIVIVTQEGTTSAAPLTGSRTPKFLNDETVSRSYLGVLFLMVFAGICAIKAVKHVT